MGILKTCETNIFQRVDGSARRVEGNLAASVLSPVNEKAGYSHSAKNVGRIGC